MAIRLQALYPEYAISDLDEANETLAYYGFLDKRGYWYILKLTPTSARYVKGTTGYISNWANRANLNYQYFDLVF